MTEIEKATNCETLSHIKNVSNFINIFISELLQRAAHHDDTKLVDPELSTFVEFTPKLKDSTYGSEEYKSLLEQMAPALKHHYQCNKHHPEHWKNGIDDMTLVDIIEMFCDWEAATLRHTDGDIYKSIEINSKRFNIDGQLCNIFKNTADLLKKR